MNKWVSLFVIVASLVAVVTARPLSLREGAPVDSKFIEQITRLAEDPLTFVEKRLVAELSISHSDASAYKLGFLQWMSLNFLVNATLPVASHGPFVPSVQVDEFWHNFILYTRKYHAWCFKNFGHFVHHVPEEETTSSATSAHDNSWKMTVTLMNELYGVNWGNGAADDMSCGSGGCSSSAKGGYCQSGNCKPGVCQATGGPTTTADSTTTTTTSG